MSLLVAEFFTPLEFACHDGPGHTPGTPYPEEWDDRWTILVPKTCDPIRRMHGDQIEVVSGYRTESYNAGLIAEGHHDVASASQHCLGNAADLRPRNATRASVASLHDMVLRARQVGRLPYLGGLGLYDGWIHVDTHQAPDGHLRRWDKRTAP